MIEYSKNSYKMKVLQQFLKSQNKWIQIVKLTYS